MPKNKAGAIEGPEKKKQKMAQNGAAPMEVDIDEDLHSRQLAVYGKESMRKMAAASVLVCGVKGLGIEVAKNVVLAGVKAVTIHDKEMVDQRDLGSQFYLTDEDVGKNRAESCRAKIQELNNGVVVSASSADLTNDFLAQFQVVVLTDSSLDEAKRVDEFCHASGVAFIKAETRGVFGSIFCDFGPSFTVIDPDGEEPHSGIIASILKGNPTLITCVDDERLEFQEGDLVTFSEVQGMTELCGCKPVRVTKAKPQSLEVDLDSRAFGEYTRGGLMTQVKVPKTLSFRTLAAALEQPGEFLLSDFSKLERPQLLHLAFQTLDAFQVKHGHLPRTRSDEDANALIALVKELNASLQDSIDLDEDVLRQFSFVAAGEINPMAAMFGGVVGQEVVKAASGKFTPIRQWLYFDAAEALPAGDLPAEEFMPEGSRYDAQIAVFGRTMQRKLADLRLFLVGAGALGCEFLKNFALMGIACGGSGEVTVTDDDTIEKSNLSRQFLFRDWDIGSPKSTVAAHAAQKINPGFQVKPLQNRVSPETEELFNDDFWQSLSMVVNALDNVNARLYVDARCVYFGKGLLESGTLGPKCNTQMVVPWVSENYGASRDPPEKQAPMCTLHSFPHNIDHCLTWARSEFEGLLEQAPSECNAYLNNPAQYARTVRDARDAVARQQLEKVVNLLVDERCATFDECIAWARHRFQDFFYNRVAQLTFTFPEGATTSNGLPFWSAPKRFPTAVQFDGSDPLHQAFVQAGAILQAGVFGIPVPEYASSLEEMGTRGARVAVVPFVPKEGVKIETDPNAKSAGPASSGDDDTVIEKLLSQLEAKQAGADAAYRLNPVVFEKDDDTNYHIDFISALANMRARCYRIQEVDKLKCKFIAGRIIPAIATATSVATGLVCLELYKVIQQKKLEAYRNTFANLAIPLFAMAEPIAPKVTKYKDMEWTLWDRWSIEGDLTVQEVLDWMAAKGLVTYSISYGPSLLYNNIFKKHEERLGMKVSELLQTKAALPPHKKYCDIVVACEDEEGEDVDVPLVSLKFR